ncbi:MAG: hypothetical protein DMF11_01065 [Verrucomicrobia bacterium]|nr:MAG: hypothetical protein DMF11_01065 [Verrucomicrobiota bacterium]
MQVAVGRDVGRNESLIVKGDREGQTDKGCAIVGVIASIEGAGHDGAGSGGNRIIVRRAPSTGISDFQLIRKGWRQTRERRGRTGGASLHAAVFRATIVGSHPIEDVKEAALALIEDHFKVGRATSVKISRAPFNVKLPVGRGAGDRGEDAAAAGESRAVGRCIGPQVVLIR